MGVGMKIIKKPSTFIPENEDCPISKTLTSVNCDTNKAYILNDAGFKKQFGNYWEEIKNTCTKFCQEVGKRYPNGISEYDLDKYYYNIMCVVLNDTLRKKGRKTIERIINTIFCGDKWESLRLRYKIVLLGETHGNTKIKTRKESQG
jgi:hypothetical protein